jgi:CheY-like chemotaxis protein
MSISWRVLVVEDKADIAKQLAEIIPTCVEEPDTAEAEICNTFGEAMKRLRWENFDVIVLDLKDDSEHSSDADDDPAGVKVFDELRKTRFVPVVFYTALPKSVPVEETSFIRIVEKTQSVTRVKEEIKAVLATKLPGLTKQIEDFHRSYMWEFVTTHWKDFATARDQSDIAYLLARRLAILLERQAVTLAGSVVGGEKTALAHPMMHYLTPPLGTHRMAGDLVREIQGETETFWIVLTPSCDFAQNKAHHVVIAKCERLTELDEYKSWIKDHPKEPSKTSAEAMASLIGNNRRGQAERFKFLPGTFFLPDLVVDFQQLRSITKEAADALEPVASLDSPFAESLLASFARYFGRLGTPDLDKSLVLDRLKSALSAAAAGGKK